MREIYLSDRKHHLKKNAFLELEVFCVYPEDEASRQQAHFILGHEAERWNRIGAEDFSPSSLTNTLLESLGKSTARRFTCGLVALSMCALDNAGEQMSLEKAAEVVTEFNIANDKAPFSYWKRGEWSQKDRKLIGDTATIKRVFREYRSVSHILAAGIVAGHYLDLMHPFERSPDADACFFSTVLYFQHRLRKVKNFESWNLWEVRISPPYPPEDYPPLEFTFEQIQHLIGPWLLKNHT